MTEFLRFALLGLGAGALFGLVGQGLVLIYRGSGVLNFAHGAFVAAGAYGFYDLTHNAGLAVVPAALTTLLLAAAAGALVHVLVMSRLAAAGAFVKLIATLGIWVALEQAIVMRYGTDPLVSTPFLPSSSIALGHGIGLGVDRLIILGIAVCVSLALTAWLRYARTGLGLSAIGEDALAAASLGFSPLRLGALTWALGCALAALAGILLAPISGLDPSTLTLAVIPALAAALVGRFRSFGLTLLGGLMIGITESLTSYYVTAPGWSSSVPFVVIVLALMLGGDSLPGRGALVERLPRVGSGQLRPVWALAGVAAALILVLAVLPATWTDGISASLEVALVCASIVVVTGFAGQLSLAQFALAGVGALVAARVAVAGGPYLLALVLAALATVPVGLVVGFPALRVRGASLAIATLGLGLVIQNLVLQDQAWTGGLNGLAVGDIHLFGLDVDPIHHSGRYAAVLIVVVAVVLVGVANLRRSPIGRQLLAARGNERAAAVLGANVTALKLYAFGLAAGIAGLAGGFLAFRTDLLTFDNFNVALSIRVIVLAMIGGVGFALGPLAGGVYAAGGVFAVAVSQLFGADIGSALVLASGLLTILLVVRAPDGLAAVGRTGDGPAPGGRGSGSQDASRPAPAHPAMTRGSLRRVTPAPLVVDGLAVSFGRVSALADLSLSVEPGTVTGLIGPNGAGKTTFIDAVSGLVPSASRRLTLGDRSLAGLSPYRRARCGVSRTFQSNELFDELTIRDNLLVALRPPARWEWGTALLAPARVRLDTGAELVIEVLGLGDVLDARPDELSVGMRRLAAIARSAVRWPSLLMLDEPAASLSPPRAFELGLLVRRLADECGMGIVLVEHDVDFVLRCADRVIALDFGRKIADGPPSSVRRDEAVVAAYLGVESVPAAAATAAEAAP
jgi:ABC-type branched-subunit amino acid transport system ATPase component/ABC-type branched-subunit amino acid transport system permease subunit